MKYVLQNNLSAIGLIKLEHIHLFYQHYNITIFLKVTKLLSFFVKGYLLKCLNRGIDLFSPVYNMLISKIFICPIYKNIILANFILFIFNKFQFTESMINVRFKNLIENTFQNGKNILTLPITDKYFLKRFKLPTE